MSSILHDDTQGRDERPHLLGPSTCQAVPPSWHPPAAGRVLQWYQVRAEF